MSRERTSRGGLDLFHDLKTVKSRKEIESIHQYP